MDETKNDRRRMKPVPTFEPPDYVKYLDDTSFLLISETGAAMLIDCGAKAVIGKLQKLLEEGRIKSLDACWVTHYHDDHVDFLGELSAAFGCPVITGSVMADIIRRPSCYFLPCISPAGTDVTEVDDGFTWRWHEFELTAFHFPGQTFYHNGLISRGPPAAKYFSAEIPCRQLELTITAAATGIF